MTGSTSNQVNWTKVGAAYDREAVEAAIYGLKWRRWDASSTFSFMGGMAIAEAIRHLRIPRVDMVAESPAMSPRGFYGIHAHYIGGEVWVFIVDEGDECVPVLSMYESREWTLVPRDHPAYPRRGKIVASLSGREG